MSEELTLQQIAEIREALTYALKTSVKDPTEKRLVIQEFWHALNRRKLIKNEMTEDIIRLHLRDI